MSKEIDYQEFSFLIILAAFLAALWYKQIVLGSIFPLFAIPLVLILADIVVYRWFIKTFSSFFSLLLLGFSSKLGNASKKQKQYPEADKLHRLGNYELAILEYKKELRKDYDNYEIIYRIASIYDNDLKDYLHALQEYNKLRKLKELPAEFWCSISMRVAEIYQIHLKDIPHTIEVYKEIINNFPESREAITAKSILKRLSK